jgi:hypothetical protein
MVRPGAPSSSWFSPPLRSEVMSPVQNLVRQASQWSLRRLGSDCVPPLPEGQGVWSWGPGCQEEDCGHCQHLQWPPCTLVNPSGSVLQVPRTHCRGRSSPSSSRVFSTLLQSAVPQPPGTPPGVLAFAHSSRLGSGAPAASLWSSL